MKLHLACGSIFLQGYINCDAWGKFSYFVDNNPNITTLDNYYKRPFEQDENKRVRTEPIIDVKMDLLKTWPFADESVSDIVMICCLEHFSKKEAEFILSEVKRVLCVYGTWKVDFPDIRAVVEQHYDNPNWMMELIYCNGKNQYSFHKYGYTEKSFVDFVGKDFRVEFKDIVKHSYPMIGAECTKQ